MTTTLKLLLCFCCVLVVAVRNRPRPPIVAEQPNKKLSRSTHCVFGNKSYELEERWRPDLGPPFGVLYCVRCECSSVRKKKRLVSKVRCRNFKFDCPKPTCLNPVLLPYRCCKTCPGQDDAHLEEDIASRKLEGEDENAVKEFSSLLTGRGLIPQVYRPTQASARVYAVLHKRNLHYTIHYSSMDTPSSVRLTDEEGSILEEQQVHNSPNHVNLSIVCGVWRSVPKIYRRLLHKDRLHFVLPTALYPEGHIGGKLTKNIRIETEVYSALLTAEDLSGSGGTAIISPVQDSFHIVIDFNGVFSSSDSHDVATFVRINNWEEDILVAEAVVIVSKTHPEHNRVNVKMPLTPEIQTMLTEGKLEMIINSTAGGTTLRGPVVIKPTCNVFQAVLTTDKIISEEEQGGLKSRPAGFALFSINNDGTINYKLHTVGMDPGPSSIVLQTGIHDGRNLSEIDHLYFSEGWANGTFADTSAQVAEMLMNDDLYLSIFAADHQNELQGRVHQRHYTDAFDSDTPLLLFSGLNSTVGGMAWLSIDKECFLHYEVDVSYFDHDNDGKGHSEIHYVELLLQLPKYNNQLQQVLKKLEGDEISDVTDVRMLSALKSGKSFLLITTKISGRGKLVELRGPIERVYVPASCLTKYGDPDVRHSGGIGYVDDTSNEVYNELSNMQCYYEGRIFDDGSQWKAEHNTCLMCSCQKGQIVCDPIVCPPPVCENPTLLHGECCPMCLEVDANSTVIRPSKGCYLEGDKKYHLAGSRWHPYVPPFGFSVCVICTCQPESLTVECQRTTCPPLSCPDNQAYRENPRACCKKCSNEVPKKPKVVALPLSALGDQGRIKTSKDILAEGGCRFRGQVFVNGAEWHPTVQPFGEMLCVKCHCKDGRSKCTRQRCPKLSCVTKVHRENECCARCRDSSEYFNDSRPPKKEKRKRKVKNKRHIFVDP